MLRRLELSTGLPALLLMALLILGATPITMRVTPSSASAGVGAMPSVTTVAAVGSRAAALADGFDPCTGAVAIVTGPACWAANHAGSIGSFLSNPAQSLVADAGNAALQAITGFFVTGCVWFLGQVADLVTGSTSVTPAASWFTGHYLLMTQIAAWLILLFLLLNAAGVVIHRDPARIGRSVGMVAVAVFGTATAVAITSLLLQVSDQLSATVSGSTGGDLRSALQAAANTLGHLDSSIPPLAVALAALIGVLGAVAIWVELLVRSIGIYAGLLFFPLALAGLVASTRNRWVSRLTEALIVLIFSKFIIVAVLSLAAAAVNSAGAGYQGVLAGSGLLLLAAFAPWLLLRLLNVAEHAVTFTTAAQLRASAQHKASSAGQLAMRTVVAGAAPAPGAGAAGAGGSSGGPGATIRSSVMTAGSGGTPAAAASGSPGSGSARHARGMPAGGSA
jgi:hypothetical protein